MSVIPNRGTSSSGRFLSYAAGRRIQGLCWLVAIIGFAHAASALTTAVWWSDYIIVQPRNQAALDAIKSSGYEVKDQYGDPAYYRVLIRKKNDNERLSFDEAAFELGSYREIISLQKDYVVNGLLTPNDPAASTHWNIIGAPFAWDITTGSNSETIAIVDAGGDSTHPDLLGRVIGAAPDIDAVDNDSDASGTISDTGHAARVAGVAAAIANNAADMAGIDWNARILFVRGLWGEGNGSLVTVAKGIRAAVLNKASVINLSIGAVADTAVMVTEDALRMAYNARIPVVASAGNGGADAYMTYPATSRYTIAVGSSSNVDARSSFSAYQFPAGMSGVDLVAPGENVVTLTQGFGTGSWSGTSMSAAIVSGAITLLKTLRAEYTPRNFLELLTATAKDIGTAGRDAESGAGRLDLFALLSAAKTATLFPFANDSAAIRSDSFSVDPVGDARTATTSADGRQGRRRLVLNGNNVYAGYGGALAGETGTIEFYFRCDSIQPTDTAYILTQMGNGAKPKGSLDLILRSDSRLQFSLQDSCVLVSRTRLNPNQWYHIAVSWGLRGISLVLNGETEALRYIAGGPPIADMVYLGAPSATGASSVRGSFDGLRFSSTQRVTFPTPMSPRIESIAPVARDMITVRWTAIKNETTSTVINVYADRDSVGFDGTLIASQLANDGYEGISATILQSFNQPYYIYIEAVDGTYTGEAARVYYDTPATVFSSASSFVKAVDPKSDQICILGAYTPHEGHTFLRRTRDLLLRYSLTRWIINIYYGVAS